MRYLTLVALLAPAIALAQNSQSTCVNTPPIISCTSRDAASIPQVATPDLVGAYQRGREAAAREEALRQEAELAAEQRRNLQQSQQSDQQRLIAAEAAVVRQALVAYVEEQSKLPEAQRIHDQTAAGQRIGQIARQMLGRDPSNEAFALAAKQLEAIPTPTP